MSGKIYHASVGSEMTQAEFESQSLHTINGVPDLSVVRSHTIVVAPSNASAACKAESDGVCSGVDDDQTIVDAIADAGYKDVLCLPGTYNTSGLITLGGGAYPTAQSLRFCEGSFIVHTSDTGLFRLMDDARLHLGHSVVSCAGYAPTLILMDAGNALLEGARLYGDRGAGTGTAISVTPGAGACQYNQAHDVMINGFDYGLKVVSNANPNFCGSFTRIQGQGCNRLIFESKGASSIHANIYEATAQYANPPGLGVTAVVLAGWEAQLQLGCWDFENSSTKVLNILAGSNYNRALLFGTEGEDNFTNSGTYNTIWTPDSIMVTTALRPRVIRTSYGYSSFDLAALDYAAASMKTVARVIGSSNCEAFMCFNGAILTHPPTNADLPAGYWTLALNNTTGEITAYGNVGGAIKTLSLGSLA